MHGLKGVMIQFSCLSDLDGGRTRKAESDAQHFREFGLSQEQYNLL